MTRDRGIRQGRMGGGVVCGEDTGCRGMRGLRGGQGGLARNEGDGAVVGRICAPGRDGVIGFQDLGKGTALVALPRFWNQLTLSQPGGQIMPTTVLWALSGSNSPWRP